MELIRCSIVIFTILILSACTTETPQSTTSPVDTIPEVARIEEKSNLEKEHELVRAGYADSVNLGLIADDTFKGSARRETSGTVAGAEVIINYGSPGKRGRVIWNGLVSYDQVWVSGAHWATAITFKKNVKIEGIDIKAGTYGFFTVPGKEVWTLIINKKFDQHLADNYSKSDDIVRVKVMPEISDTITERLTYFVEAGEGQKGIITMSWDNIKVAMPFEVL